MCTWSCSNFWSSLCSCLDFFLSHKIFRKGFDMPHCSSFCWSTSGGLSTFLKTRMLIICATYKMGINAHEKHSSLSRLQFTLLMHCDVIFFFFFCSSKNTSLDILVKQISECVRCWEQCTFGLTQYVNVNISCAHKWMQTCFISMQNCDDFTALHLQLELFSHALSLENVGIMSSFLSQMQHSTGDHVLTVLTSGNILV